MRTLVVEDEKGIAGFIRANRPISLCRLGVDDLNEREAHGGLQ
jgi:hypothetical protein